MTRQEFAAVRALFDELAELPEASRQERLAQESATRPTVVERVRRLLEAGATGLDRLEGTLASAREPGRDQVVGPYRLVERLGEGGMGEVWLAEQSAPIRRRVALKMIKAGMDTRQVIARFEAERQALALLSHAAVAAVLDAGETTLGRPYFVMEYVDGCRIDRYCDDHRLPVEERLRLFQRVCEGVQHAHTRTIIHRDLKPSNILVVSTDQGAQPKIIDFGIAKALVSEGDRATRLTELGQPLGTPEYMSPEQLGLGDGAVDTRTDVYALGVLLYELLTGSLPHRTGSATTGRSGGPAPRDGARTPSLQVARCEGLERIARERASDPAELVRTLKGDLDWIVLKALDPDPERRYASPRELGEDLGRFMESRPVVARAPTAAYLATRFVRRHRAGVAAAAGVALSLVAGVVATASAWQRAVEAEQLARQEARTASQALEFVTGLFEAADPQRGGRATADVFELVGKGAHRLEAGLVEDPLVAARLAATVGDIYAKLGDYEPGLAWLEKAYREQRRLLGREDPASLDTAERIAFLYWGYGPVEKALAIQQEVVEARRRLHGPDDVRSLRAEVMLGTIFVRLGRGGEAEAAARSVAERGTRALGGDSPLVLDASALLSSALRAQGRDAEAEPVLRRVVDGRREVLGEVHVDTAAAEQMLARLLVKLGRYEESEALLDGLMERVVDIFGPGHKAGFRTLSTYAYLRGEQGRLEESLELNRRVLEGFRSMLKPGHPDIGLASRALAETLVRLDRSAEAEVILVETLAEEKRANGELGPASGPTVAALAEIHAAWGDPGRTALRLAEL